MQDTPKLDKPLPVSSFVLQGKCKVVQSLDKLSPLRYGPFNIINNSTEVTYELLTPD